MGLRTGTASPFSPGLAALPQCTSTCGIGEDLRVLGLRRPVPRSSWHWHGCGEKHRTSAPPVADPPVGARQPDVYFDKLEYR